LTSPSSGKGRKKRQLRGENHHSGVDLRDAQDGNKNAIEVVQPMGKRTMGRVPGRRQRADRKEDLQTGEGEKAYAADLRRKAVYLPTWKKKRGRGEPSAE